MIDPEPDPDPPAHVSGFPGLPAGPISFTGTPPAGVPAARGHPVTVPATSLAGDANQVWYTGRPDRRQWVKVSVSRAAVGSNQAAAH
ncbi:hypothetical protein ACWFRB_22250 [Rhodococcus sp. NPDC055112]